MPSSTHAAAGSNKRRSASSSRASASARNDIIAMLKTDHRKVKKAFRDFARLDEEKDADACKALVQQTCRDLKIHARLEEERFYPAARECLGDEALIDEAEVEHEMLDVLIGNLDAMAPGDEKYAATFTVLGEYVKHHIGEEEGEVFPRLSHVKYDWEALRQAMEDRRESLAGELGGAAARETDGSAGRAHSKQSADEDAEPEEA